MHGYQIIRENEDRTEGSWRPSAGSVYPTLQLLSDVDLMLCPRQGSSLRRPPRRWAGQARPRR